MPCYWGDLVYFLIVFLHCLKAAYFSHTNSHAIWKTIFQTSKICNLIPHSAIWQVAIFTVNQASDSNTIRALLCIYHPLFTAKAWRTIYSRFLPTPNCCVGARDWFVQFAIPGKAGTLRNSTPQTKFQFIFALLPLSATHWIPIHVCPLTTFCHTLNSNSSLLSHHFPPHTEFQFIFALLPFPPRFLHLAPESPNIHVRR